MKNAVALAVAAVLATATVAGAQMKKSPVVITPGASPLQKQALEGGIQSARRISRDEARKLVARGEAVFIDVRSQQSYDTAHIKGAISIPQSRLGDSLPRLPANKMLITYCACHHEETAAMAVMFFNAHGIKNAAALTGGWNEWKKAELPVEPAGVR